MGVVIASRDVLERLLERGSVIRAEWAVLCAIGPDWIGAGRRFEFWLDDVPIDDACAGHRLLARGIVEHFGLPEAHEHEATFGAAIIERRGEALWIDYEWSRGVPHANAAATGIDEAVFVLPGETREPEAPASGGP